MRKFLKTVVNCVGYYFLFDAVCNVDIGQKRKSMKGTKELCLDAYGCKEWSHYSPNFERHSCYFQFPCCRIHNICVCAHLKWIPDDAGMSFTFMKFTKTFRKVYKGKVVLLNPIFDSGLYVFDSWN